ncbi:hypothetical protein CCUS01_15290 [Colletotrichum cuscutae]|uniref:Uncharacterized protein n=1 Tax=Colletotrichum cuscutae TaxID=1209917 RepID=A0AAI9Y4M1_9PEZI|nr:hypothetical protein CCUS01_15290 [Colletotrichum cuscutae]
MDANVRDQSKRLIGVLRHSMTSYCLAPRSLSKPYSARHAARHGIVCKVSSAFTVSTAVDGCGMSEDAGMHNVIPVPSIAEWRQYTVRTWTDPISLIFFNQKVHVRAEMAKTGERMYWRHSAVDEISSLGSPKVPKVELMKTSQYQIKVENCTATKEVWRRVMVLQGSHELMFHVHNSTYPLRPKPPVEERTAQLNARLRRSICGQLT